MAPVAGNLDPIGLARLARAGRTDAAHRTAADLPIEGFDRGQVSYHLRLLYEAGFVSGEALRSTSNPERIIDFWVFDLTWQGHEFLAAARDNVAWKTVLSRITMSASTSKETL